MRHTFAIGATVVVMLLVSNGAHSQTDGREQTVREFFAGQQMLVTYREGGPIYGTFFFLQVHFCRSGRYITYGQSRKHTVLDNEQVNNFSDQGTWEVATIQGQPVLKYVSISGQPNVVPVWLTPTGAVSLGEGISLVRQGLALCK